MQRHCHLIIAVLQFGILFLKNHPEGTQCHQQTVSHITKHHSEQEGECNYGEQRCRGI